MATFQRRGDSWRALVRKKGEAPLSKSFPTKGMAKTWAERIEREIAERAASGASSADTMTLGAVIKWYTDHAKQFQGWGRTKEADLRRLGTDAIADRRASDLRLQDYVRHAEGRRRTAGPSTVGKDLVWLKQCLQAARSSLGLSVNLQALEDAAADLRRRQVTAKAKLRTRRLKPGEEAKLMAHFASRDVRSDMPLADMFQFALLTARRQEEMTLIKWAELDPVNRVGWLDDVKHPRRKTGNRRCFRILSEAWAIIERQPRTAEYVFPYNHRSISTAFTRACQFLGIKDLRWHDLRHEAASRLFERGYSIQEVAQFTLHESWATLRRYTHLRPQDVPERATSAT